MFVAELSLGCCLWEGGKHRGHQSTGSSSVTDKVGFSRISEYNLKMSILSAKLHEAGQRVPSNRRRKMGMHHTALISGKTGLKEL